ncbi:hypothetical protein GCM10007380_08340 [Gottfriedia solisilvae]|uniref:Uncharacterized protein n=1 Tax=Gottfriedia solisilvae TaxID=1516104 RepID=A0A8J3EUB8_9BACI|nr:hypothetical protein [Gottfriedia solisilvae]GGI11538.1 hypothetical protein GCM10007380_08340 [Gottfriedia solisilvae]
MNYVTIQINTNILGDSHANFFNKIRKQFLKNGLKPFVIIGIIFAILLLSGNDINIKDSFFYLVVYFIGKNTIHYFESKKINLKQNFKDISIFIFLAYLYHIIYLTLVAIGYKPIKFLSNGIGFMVTTLVVISLFYITFVVPFEILKQKRRSSEN